jgi:hypothetical protein
MTVLQRYLDLEQSVLGNTITDNEVTNARLLANAFGSDIDALVNYAEYGNALGPIRDFTRTIKDYHEFQIAALENIQDSTAHMTLIKTARQMGLSTMLCTYALYAALSGADQTIMYLGAPSNNYDTFYYIVRAHLYHQQKLGYSDCVARFQKTEIEFENGSRILFRPRTINSARGMSISLLLVDDAARAPADLFHSVAPIVSRGGNNTRIVMGSCPEFATGMFYDLWTTYPTANRIDLTWRDHPHWDEAWAERYRPRMSPKDWAREYEAEFISRD